MACELRHRRRISYRNLRPQTLGMRKQCAVRLLYLPALEYFAVRTVFCCFDACDVITSSLKLMQGLCNRNSAVFVAHAPARLELQLLVSA